MIYLILESRLNLYSILLHLFHTVFQSAGLDLSTVKVHTFSSNKIEVIYYIIYGIFKQESVKISKNM